MTTTPTTPRPHVPLPAGAVTADDWQSVNGEMPYRIVRGADRAVADGPPVFRGEPDKIVVWTAATQFADGTLDDGSWMEAPDVHVLVNNATVINAMSPEQTADLIAKLTDALAEVKRWRGTESG